MWFEWPLLYYQEWLRMLQTPVVPTDPMTVRKLGMTESATEVVLVAEAPAFKNSELDATVRGNEVDIRGERYEQVEGGELHVTYERKIPLPRSVNAQKAETSVHNGRIEIHIPKREGIDALAL
jgi:HSP20 family molecular chaperone IbpA